MRYALKGHWRIMLLRVEYNYKGAESQPHYNFYTLGVELLTQKIRRSEVQLRAGRDSGAHESMRTRSRKASKKVAEAKRLNAPVQRPDQLISNISIPITPEDSHESPVEFDDVEFLEITETSGCKSKVRIRFWQVAECCRTLYSNN